MAKKSPAEHAWSIFRIRKTPAELLGRVCAPDQDTAIRKAIELFKITNPEHQKRRIAQRA